MSSLLYLDTARLGRMSPSAQRAHRDFVRFAGEEGCPLYFEEYLTYGFEPCPRFFKSRYPGLRSWRGVGGLKQQLRRLTGTPSDFPVLLANRSAQLMRLAAQLLFMPCENVLVTDLGWPPYRAILEAERKRTRKHLTDVAVREPILRNGADEDSITSLLSSRFDQSGCDGLFLTAISHDGVRLPVERIVAHLAKTTEVRFVAVDGAQDFCHANTNLAHGRFDLYLAGSHKWLKAYHPLGIAFYGKRRSQVFIETIRNEMIQCGALDDPLLRVTEQLETDKLDGSTETVNLTSLFSCSGAVYGANEASSGLDGDFQTQLRNSRLVVQATSGIDWHPLQPADSFQSGILILQSKRNSVRSAPAQTIREAFQRQRIAVTAYDNGIIRLSMPRQPLAPMHLNRIRSALRKVS